MSAQQSATRNACSAYKETSSAKNYDNLRLEGRSCNLPSTSSSHAPTYHHKDAATSSNNNGIPSTPYQARPPRYIPASLLGDYKKKSWDRWADDAVDGVLCDTGPLNCESDFPQLSDEARMRNFVKWKEFQKNFESKQRRRAEQKADKENRRLKRATYYSRVRNKLIHKLVPGFGSPAKLSTSENQPFPFIHQNNLLTSAPDQSEAAVESNHYQVVENAPTRAKSKAKKSLATKRKEKKLPAKNRYSKSQYSMTAIEGEIVNVPFGSYIQPHGNRRVRFEDDEKASNNDNALLGSPIQGTPPNHSPNKALTWTISMFIDYVRKLSWNPFTKNKEGTGTGGGGYAWGATSPQDGSSNEPLPYLDVDELMAEIAVVSDDVEAEKDEETNNGDINVAETSISYVPVARERRGKSKNATSKSQFILPTIMEENFKSYGGGGERSQPCPTSNVEQNDDVNPPLSNDLASVAQPSKPAPKRSQKKKSAATKAKKNRKINKLRYSQSQSAISIPEFVMPASSQLPSHLVVETFNQTLLPSSSAVESSISQPNELMPVDVLNVIDVQTNDANMIQLEKCANADGMDIIDDDEAVQCIDVEESADVHMDIDFVDQDDVYDGESNFNDDVIDAGFERQEIESLAEILFKDDELELALIRSLYDNHRPIGEANLEARQRLAEFQNQSDHQHANLRGRRGRVPDPLDFYGMSFTGSDIPALMINDPVRGGTDDYMQSNQMQAFAAACIAHAGPATNRRIALLDSFYQTLLIRPSIRPFLRMYTEDPDLILCFVHLPGKKTEKGETMAHWTLLSINVTDNEATYYDTLFPSRIDAQPRRIIDNIVAALHEEGLLAPGTTVRQAHRSTYNCQDDGKNCGVHACLIAEHIARHGDSIRFANGFNIIEEKQRVIGVLEEIFENNRNGGARRGVDVWPAVPISRTRDLSEEEEAETNLFIARQMVQQSARQRQRIAERLQNQQTYEQENLQQQPQQQQEQQILRNLQYILLQRTQYQQQQFHPPQQKERQQQLKRPLQKQRQPQNDVPTKSPRLTNPILKAKKLISDYFQPLPTKQNQSIPFTPCLEASTSANNDHSHSADATKTRSKKQVDFEDPDEVIIGTGGEINVHDINTDFDSFNDAPKFEGINLRDPTLPYCLDANYPLQNLHMVAFAAGYIDATNRIAFDRIAVLDPTFIQNYTKDSEPIFIQDYLRMNTENPELIQCFLNITDQKWTYLSIHVAQNQALYYDVCDTDENHIAIDGVDKVQCDVILAALQNDGILDSGTSLTRADFTTFNHNVLSNQSAFRCLIIAEDIARQGYTEHYSNLLFDDESRRIVNAISRLHFVNVTTPDMPLKSFHGFPDIPGWPEIPARTLYQKVLDETMVAPMVAQLPAKNSLITAAVTRPLKHQAEIFAPRRSKRIQSQRKKPTKEQINAKIKSLYQRRIPVGYNSSDVYPDEDYRGAMNKLCPFCQARLFDGECSNKCCQNGTVPITPIPPLTGEMTVLLNNPEFRNLVRPLNSLFAMVSTCSNIKMGDGMFKIQGEPKHNVGDLITKPGRAECFVQNYMMDADAAVANRYRDLTSLGYKPKKDFEGCNEMISRIEAMIRKYHPLPKVLKTMKEQLSEYEAKCQELGKEVEKLYLVWENPNYSTDEHPGRFNKPTTSNQVFSVFKSKEGGFDGKRGIWFGIKKDGSDALRRVPDFDEHLSTAAYPLILLHGQPGWRPKIRKLDPNDKDENKFLGSDKNGVFQDDLDFYNDIDVDDLPLDETQESSHTNDIVISVGTPSNEINMDSSAFSVNDPVNNNYDNQDVESDMNYMEGDAEVTIDDSVEDEEMDTIQVSSPAPSQSITRSVSSQTTTPSLQTQKSVLSSQTGKSTAPTFINTAIQATTASQYLLPSEHRDDSQFNANCDGSSDEEIVERKRLYVSQNSLLRSQFFDRTDQQKNEFNPITGSGCLSAQYAIDGFSRIEKERQDYAEAVAAKLSSTRYDTSKNIREAITRMIDKDPKLKGKQLGKVLLINKKWRGGKRYMQMKYKNGIAISAKHGKEDLFVTMTGNPHWREIRENLRPGEKWETRSDLVCRVFSLKAEELLKDLLIRGIFGKVRAFSIVLEHQKRGMPHLHMLLTLEDGYKLNTAAKIDDLICAEIPEMPKEDDPNYEEKQRYWELVMKMLVHDYSRCATACGKGKKKGTCSKNFPQVWVESTSIGPDGNTSLRRRNDGRYVVRRYGNRHPVNITNQYIVAHNRFATMKYNCHINVLPCGGARTMKYLHKYINKGHDRAFISVRSANSKNTGASDVVDYNEFHQHRNLRVLGQSEATCRIMGMMLCKQSHTVMDLPVHLKGEHTISFKNNDAASDILQKTQNDGTQPEEPAVSELTAFFKLVQEERDNPKKFDKKLQKIPAASLCYHEIFEHYCYNRKRWVRRKNARKSLARLQSVWPSDVERFCLRELLKVIPGPASYAELRNYKGITYATFREAAVARGLFIDDAFSHRIMEEIVSWAMPRQCRQNFALLLVYNRPNDPQLLWDTFRDYFLDRNPLPDAEKERRALAHVASIIYRHQKTMKDFDLPDVPEADLMYAINDDFSTLADDATLDATTLNVKQRQFFETVMRCFDQGNVKRFAEKLFFLQASGGTGKTYLLNFIIRTLRNRGYKVIAVASTGIAAILLDGGQTAHSAFRIPLDEFKKPNIAATHPTAKIIREADCIIWDESPMQRRGVFESVDELCQDLAGPYFHHQPFGGKVVILAGDFKQLLPVVKNENPRASYEYSLLCSDVFREQFKIHTLEHNIRAANDEEYARWLNDVGNDVKEDKEDQDPAFLNKVQLPDNTSVFTQRELIDFVYPDDIFPPDFTDAAVFNNYCNYVANVALIAPKRDMVEHLNNSVILKLPGVARTYTSLNQLSESAYLNDILADDIQDTEVLNAYNHASIPPHQLVLKVGSVVMLTRNLDTHMRLCNGTRMVILRMEDHHVQCRVITGETAGTDVAIYPIANLFSEPTENMPDFSRYQMPLRPAFAFTSNKSQGQTLDKVGVDLSTDCFSHGQFYVSASRVRHRDDIRFFVNPQNTGLTADNERVGYAKNIVYPEVMRTVNQLAAPESPIVIPVGTETDELGIPSVKYSNDTIQNQVPYLPQTSHVPAITTPLTVSQADELDIPVTNASIPLTQQPLNPSKNSSIAKIQSQRVLNFSQPSYLPAIDTSLHVSSEILDIPTVETRALAITSKIPSKSTDNEIISCSVAQQHKNASQASSNFEIKNQSFNNSQTFLFTSMATQLPSSVDKIQTLAIASDMEIEVKSDEEMDIEVENDDELASEIDTDVQSDGDDFMDYSDFQDDISNASNDEDDIPYSVIHDSNDIDAQSNPSEPIHFTLKPEDVRVPDMQNVEIFDPMRYYFDRNINENENVLQCRNGSSTPRLRLHDAADFYSSSTEFEYIGDYDWLISSNITVSLSTFIKSYGKMDTVAYILPGVFTLPYNITPEDLLTHHCINLNQNTEFVMAPIGNKSHWIALVFNRNLRNFHLYNPTLNPERNPDFYAKRYKDVTNRFMQAMEFAFNESFTSESLIIQQHIPDQYQQQEYDPNSCGLFVIRYMERIIKGEDWSLDSNLNIYGYRKRLQDMYLEGLQFCKLKLPVLQAHQIPNAPAYFIQYQGQIPQCSNPLSANLKSDDQ